MVIVFAEDQTVSVLPDLGSVRTQCETIDVENGVYRFFDEFGRKLIPRWIAPVERQSILGTKWVGGGEFELELDPLDQGSAFEASLENVVAIDPNPRFETIADLARQVAENRDKSSRS